MVVINKNCNVVDCNIPSQIVLMGQQLAFTGLILLGVVKMVSVVRLISISPCR